MLGDYLSGGNGVGLLNKKAGVRGSKQSPVQWLPNFVLYLGIASVAQG